MTRSWSASERLVANETKRDEAAVGRDVRAERAGVRRRPVRRARDQVEVVLGGGRRQGEHGEDDRAERGRGEPGSSAASHLKDRSRLCQPGSPDPAFASSGLARRRLQRGFATRQRDRGDGGVEGVLVRQGEVARAAERLAGAARRRRPPGTRPRVPRASRRASIRGKISTAAGDAGPGASNGHTATPARRSSARWGIPRIDCRPTVPLPPAWKVERAPAAAAAGAVSVSRKRSRPSRPASASGRMPAPQKGRGRSRAGRAASSAARAQASAASASPSASRYQRGHEKAKSRPTIVDGSASTAASSAATASRRSRPVSSDASAPSRAVAVQIARRCPARSARPDQSTAIAWRNVGRATPSRPTGPAAASCPRS